MSTTRNGSGEPNFVRTDQYAEIGEAEETTELTFPEDLSTLSDSEIQELSSKARELFNSNYSENPSDDQLETLAEITENIKNVDAELSSRNEQREARRAKVQELASAIGADEQAQTQTEEPAEKADTEAQVVVEDETAKVEEPAQTEQSEKAEQKLARRSFKMPAVKRDVKLPESTESKLSVSDVVTATESVAGYGRGQGITLADGAKLISHNLSSFNETRYATAHRNGQHLRSANGVFSIRKNTPEELTYNGSNAEQVLKLATDESRLEGNSLVASGGWCAPSETRYDTLLELETSEGLFDLPEINVTRGGISRSLGANFAEIFNDIQGFHYTEAEDIAGNYDGNGGGSKPCYKVECTDFEEFRLDVDGLCITAGLLQLRAYPEYIERVVRGALVAHQHRMSARTLADVEKGSKAISMASHEGATESILTAIELQVQHMRYANRLSPNRSLEAVFPFWVKGAIRTDLAKRNGVDLLDVPDARITAWFAQRGVNAQFVYNWQDLNAVESTKFTGWGNELKFLLYPAGTWVRGTNDIIEMQTLFDSQQLKTNDYTALFTEEGYMVVPMGFDSRVISVPLVPSGVTAQQIDLKTPGVALTSGMANPAFAEPTNAIQTPQATPVAQG